MPAKQRIVYVTTSEFKREENRAFVECDAFDDRVPVGDIIGFEFRERPVLQILEVDIETMVREGVVNAYKDIKSPCIVEYAGLIFEKYLDSSYPGGLTKAM